MRHAFVGAMAGAAYTAVLTACGAPATGTTPPPSAVSASSSPMVAQLNTPTHLTYPAVKVDADVHPTGLDSKGEIAVPPLDKAAEVDYLHWAPTMIADRPIVLISHRNGRRPDGSVLPGGFGHLPDAKVGDMLTVNTAAGADVKWRVSAVASFPKDRFPASVYDKTTTPKLLMITCVGTVVDHNYQSNEIVTAVPA